MTGGYPALCQPLPASQRQEEADSWHPDLWGPGVILRKSRLDNRFLSDRVRHKRDERPVLSEGLGTRLIPEPNPQPLNLLKSGFEIQALN